MFFLIFASLRLFRPLMTPKVSLVVGLVLIIGFIILDFGFHFNFESIVFRRMRLRTIKKHKNKEFKKSLGYKVFDIDDDGIRARTAYDFNKLSWDRIVKVVKGDKNYSLYISQIEAIVIPKRAFESQDQIDEFERIVKRNIQKHMAV